MAIGLDDALLSWLVASAGDAVVRRLRDAPAIRATRQVVKQAVEVTVAEVAGDLDGHRAEHLRRSLMVRDTTPGVDGAQVASEAELRHALYVWTAALDHPEFGEPGYLSELGVDARQLADTLTSNIAAGIQRNGRSGGALDGLAAWLWRDGVSDQLVRIEKQLDAAAGHTESLGGGLPGGTPDFTGRQQPLVELTQRVQAHDPAGAVVAIHAVDGMAGVGKTELALRAAHQHKHRYPDGQYFINLHGYTDGIPPMPPMAALEELLRQADVPGRAIPADLAGRHARWQALMANQRALVLLDNTLDADQVHPLLPNAAGCLVLITSRTRLHGLRGARPLRLDVMSPAEAMELFARLVNTSRPLDSDAVAKVVDLVGRLPVAVQAVAGLVERSYTETDLAEELAGVKTGVGLLKEASPLEVGVRTAFETSVGRLHPPHRRAFRILGLHPGPSIGVPQFAACADLPIPAARAMLRALADRNLIIPSRDRVGHHRYELHDLMREFARNQASSHVSVEERVAATERLTTWYTAAMAAIARLRDAAGSPDGSGVEGLDLDGLGSAHQWMAAEQHNLLAFAEAVAGVPSADVCQEAARHLYYLAYYGAARSLYERAANTYHRSGYWSEEASARAGLGKLARITGDYAAAGQHYREAIDAYQRTGNQSGEASARVGLGQVARITGEYAAAGQHYREARRIYRLTGNRSGEASALAGFGHVARLTGDYAAAGQHYREARDIYRLTGNRSQEAAALWGMGKVAQATGDYSAATEYYEAALTIRRRRGNRSGEASALNGLGQVAQLTGDYAAAGQHYRAAHDIFKQVGNQSGEASTLEKLGRLSLIAGDHEAAEAQYRDALVIRRRTGTQAGEAFARHGLGDVACATGHYRAAEEHYCAALATFQQIGHRDGGAEVMCSLGHMAEAQGLREDAGNWWRNALAILKEIGSPSATSVCSLLEGLELE